MTREYRESVRLIHQTRNVLSYTKGIDDPAFDKLVENSNKIVAELIKVTPDSESPLDYYTYENPLPIDVFNECIKEHKLNLELDDVITLDKYKDDIYPSYTKRKNKGKTIDYDSCTGSYY